MSWAVCSGDFRFVLEKSKVEKAQNVGLAELKIPYFLKYRVYFVHILDYLLTSSFFLF